MSASACSASWCAGASSSTAWYSLTASRSLFFSRLLRARSRCLLMSWAMGKRAFLGFCGLAGEVRPRVLPRHRHGSRFFRAGRTSTIYWTPSRPQNEFSPACSEAPQKTEDWDRTIRGPFAVSQNEKIRPGNRLRTAATLCPGTRARLAGQFLHLLAHGFQRQPAAHQSHKSQENKRNRQRQKREKRKALRSRSFQVKDTQSQNAKKLVRAEVGGRVGQRHAQIDDQQHHDRGQKRQLQVICPHHRPQTQHLARRHQQRCEYCRVESRRCAHRVSSQQRAHQFSGHAPSRVVLRILRKFYFQV